MSGQPTTCNLTGTHLQPPLSSQYGPACSFQPSALAGEAEQELAAQLVCLTAQLEAMQLIFQAARVEVSSKSKVIQLVQHAAKAKMDEFRAPPVIAAKKRKKTPARTPTSEDGVGTTMDAAGIGAHALLERYILDVVTYFHKESERNRDVVQEKVTTLHQAVADVQQKLNLLRRAALQTEQAFMDKMANAVFAKFAGHGVSFSPATHPLPGTGPTEDAVHVGGAEVIACVKTTSTQELQRQLRVLQHAVDVLQRELERRPDPAAPTDATGAAGTGASLNPPMLPDEDVLPEAVSASEVSGVVTALQAHMSNDTIVLLACSTIRCMVSGCNKEAGAAFQPCILALLQVLQAYTHHVEIMDATCAALQVISGNNDNANLVADANGVSMLIKVLDTHMGNEGVVTSVCFTLWSVAQWTSGRNGFTRAGGVPIVMMVFEVHPTSAAAITAACRILRRLALHHDMLPCIAAHGATSAVARALEAHLSDSTSAAIIASTLRNLVVVNSEVKLLADVGGIAIMLAALKCNALPAAAHPICDVLQRLLAHSVENRTLFAELEGTSLLRRTLEANLVVSDRSVLDPRLVLSACKAIASMTLDEASLQSAVDAGCIINLISAIQRNGHDSGILHEAITALARITNVVANRRAVRELGGIQAVANTFFDNMPHFPVMFAACQLLANLHRSDGYSITASLDTKLDQACATMMCGAVYSHKTSLPLVHIVGNAMEDFGRGRVAEQLLVTAHAVEVFTEAVSVHAAEPTVLMHLCGILKQMEQLSPEFTPWWSQGLHAAVRALPQHVGNRDVMLCICPLLRSLHRNDLRKVGGLGSVLSALPLHMDDPVTLDNLTNLLHFFVSDESVHDEVMRRDVVPVLLQIMARYPNEGTAIRAVYCVASLTDPSKRVTDRIMECNGIPALLDVLDARIDHAGMVAEACIMLTTMSNPVYAAMPPKCADVLLRVMAMYITDGHVMEMAISALGHCLMQPQKTLNMRLLAEGVALPLLIRVLEQQLATDVVVDRTCTAILNLTMADEEAFRVVAVTGVSHILAVIKTHMADPEVVLSACLLLRKIHLPIVAHNRAPQEGDLQILAQALRTHMRRPDLVAHISFAIANVYTPSRGGDIRLHRADECAPLLAAALKAHMHEPFVVAQVCAPLCAFVHAGDVGQQAVWIPLLVKAFVRHKAHTSVVDTAGGTLDALSSRPDSRALVLQVATPAVFEEAKLLRARLK